MLVFAGLWPCLVGAPSALSATFPPLGLILCHFLPLVDSSLSWVGKKSQTWVETEFHGLQHYVLSE